MLPDGEHFVVGCVFPSSGDVRIYHIDGTLVHTFVGHTSGVYAVAVTHDGQHIISGANDRLVKVWNVASKSLVRTIKGHTGEITSLAVMPDGQRFLSAARRCDRTVRVSLLSGARGSIFKVADHLHSVTALVALPDNQHALAGSSDGTVKLFNVSKNNGAVLRTFKLYARSRWVICLALMPDGLRFVSSSTDPTNCTVRIVEHGLAPQ